MSEHGGTRRRGRPRVAGTEEAVLAAARELLTTQGVKGLSLGTVARAAGVGKPAIYRRWPSRASLLYDLLFRADDTVLPVPDTGSVRSDLVAGLSALAAMFNTELGSEAGRSILTEALRDEQLRARLRSEQFQRDRDAVAEIFRRGAARGETTEWPDPQLPAEMLIAWLLDRCLIRAEPPSTAMIEQAVDTILRGSTARE